MRKCSLAGLLVGLVLFTSFAFAWTFSPTSISYSTIPGSSKNYYIIFTNDQNNSYNITITKEGYIAPWLSLSSSLFSLNPGTETSPTQRVITLTINVPANVEGNYNGYLKISDGTIEKDLPINISVSKWVFKKEITVQANSKVVLTNPDFTFDVGEIGEYVNIYVAGTKYSLGPGQSYTSDNVKITVIDRWSDEAKLEIETTDPTTQVNVEQSQSSSNGLVSSLGQGLVPLISKWSFKVQQGTEKQMSVSVMNNENVPCSLKDIVVSGDVIETNEGRKPLDIGDVSLGILGPGKEFTYPVVINTKGVDLGTYIIKTELIAICGNQRQVADTVWQITVVPGVHPENNLPLQISCPKNATPGKPFEIDVNNIPAGWKAYIIQQDFMNQTSYNAQPDSIQWEGVIKKPGVYTIPIWIFKPDGSVTIHNCKIQVGKVQQKSNKQSNNNNNNNLPQLAVDIIPSQPRPNETVTLSPHDPKTYMPVSANITIKVYKGNILIGMITKTKFTVQNGYKYCIHAYAKGYKPFDKCFTVTLAPSKLVISPSKVHYGDSVTVDYLDSTGRPIPDADIKINGKDFHSSEVNFVANEKEYDIYASAPGYQPQKATIKPTVKLEIVGMNISYANQKSEIKLNANASWTVKAKNGTVIAKGSSDLISFAAPPGTYDIYVNGKLLKTIYISPPAEQTVNQTGFWQNVSKTRVAILIGLIGIGVLAKSRSKKKGRRRAGYAFDMNKGAVERIGIGG